MKGWKRSTLAILVLLMLFSFSAVNVANAAKTVIVSDVKGLYNYVPMDNSFTHGSTLKVYTDMTGVNYDGFVCVDFFFIIEDPLGHVVSMDHVDVNRRDYEDNVYVVYTKTIPSWWRYGMYKLDIYAYNPLNKAKINELERKVEVTRNLKELFDNEDAFEDMEEFFETASGGDRDDLEDLGVIKSFSDSIEEITHISFFVRREEEIKKEAPPEAKVTGETKFTVTDMQIDKFTVKPDETVSILVTVKNEGVRGTEKIALVINGEKEAEESVTLGYMASKTLYFTVKKSLLGQYKVTVPGTDIVKQFFVEESRGEGEESRGSCLPIHVFGIAFIAIAIFVFVITLLRFRLRSKQLSFNRFYR
jgi:hypothetical protein